MTYLFFDNLFTKYTFVDLGRFLDENNIKNKICVKIKKLYYMNNNYYSNDEEYSCLYDDTDNDKYIIKTNICKRLSKELQLPEIKYDDTIPYEPPREHGLSNCNVIIPSYYVKNQSKLFTIDYFEIIKDDIRNCRILNEYQLKYIKEVCSTEEKNILIDIYNICIKSINDLLSV
jgi:hypothetical protein